MTIIMQLIDFIVHIDVHLGSIIQNYGMETYIILFIIIFCETGLVVTPFLPGDSLIFAAAAFAAIGKLNVFLLYFLILFAAFLGDTVNYEIGKKIGTKLEKNGKFIKKEYIEETKRFFEKHGGKSIVLARFVPIVRTFAPFVAGSGSMKYSRFIKFNLLGSFLWVSLCVLSGFFFGNIPVVKEHFSLVVLSIVFISLMPMVIAFIMNKIKAKNNTKIEDKDINK